MPTKRKPSRRRAPQQGLVRREAQPADLNANPALAFVQLARDKSIDPEKLERLMALQERMLDRNAKAAFNAAFTEMSTELPVIARNGAITGKDKQGNKIVRSRYSKYEDIQRVCKPILKQFGFSIRHRTEWPAEKPGIIRVVGILSHLEGHSEDSAFESVADKNEYRTNIQDQGSTVSYGRRYTTIDVLNLEQEGIDNDGQGDNRTGGGGASRARSASAAAGATGGRTAGASSPPARHSDGTGNDPITQKQQQRLWVIANHAGRDRMDIKRWLAAPPYNLASSKDIKRRDYEEVCKAIEAKGPLPGASRVPGEDDE